MPSATRGSMDDAEYAEFRADQASDAVSAAEAEAARVVGGLGEVARLRTWAKTGLPPADIERWNARIKSDPSAFVEFAQYIAGAEARHHFENGTRPQSLPGVVQDGSGRIWAST